MARCVAQFSEEYERFSKKNVKWVLPKTSSQAHFWREDKIKSNVYNVFSLENGSIENNFISCEIHSYTDSAKIILNYAEENFGSNVGSIFMGSKLQTLGGALALCARGEIKNVYARPKSFDAKNYSGGTGQMWMICFDDLSKTIEGLSKCGQLEVVHTGTK